MPQRLAYRQPRSNGQFVIPDASVEFKNVIPNQPLISRFLPAGEGAPPHGFSRSLSTLNLYLSFFTEQEKKEPLITPYTFELLLSRQPIWTKSIEPSKDLAVEVGVGVFALTGVNALTNEFLNAPIIRPRESLECRITATSNITGKILIILNRLSGSRSVPSTISYAQVPMI